MQISPWGDLCIPEIIDFSHPNSLVPCTCEVQVWCGVSLGPAPTQMAENDYVMKINNNQFIEIP